MQRGRRDQHKKMEEKLQATWNWINRLTPRSVRIYWHFNTVSRPFQRQKHQIPPFSALKKFPCATFAVLQHCK